MAIKLHLILSIVAAIIYVIAQETNAVPVKPDETTAISVDDVNAKIDDAVAKFQESFKDLVKNIEGNNLVQNITASVKSFGEAVQKQGQELVNKISQSKTATN